MYRVTEEAKQKRIESIRSQLMMIANCSNDHEREISYTSLSVGAMTMWHLGVLSLEERDELLEEMNKADDAARKRLKTPRR